MNKTCLQCGAILLSGVRVCSFCDSRLPDAASSAASPGHQTRGNHPLDQPADSVWRGELANRVASYRARRLKNSPDDGQTELPFEQPVTASFISQPVASAVAVAETPALDDDFSFTVAIGRTANRSACDEAQMFIDVSVPPASNAASEFSAELAQPIISEHSGLYPVASMDERRLSGLIDAACLLFACGGFLALFGSLGGHFAFSKLTAAVYAASFAIVYVQYFSLFTVFGGTTPGMMMRGLRVVDFSGEEPSPRQFLLRAAGYMLSAGTFFLGFLWSQWDEDELTWHDRISHTYLSSANTVADSELSGVAHTR
ncbi:MAG TPA: RDD family protein [Candidatus Acidoferrum sp.]